MSEYAYAREPRRPSQIAEKTDAGTLLFRRWGGCWIDLIASGIIFVVAAFLTGFVAGALRSAGAGLSDSSIGGLGLLMGILAALAYFAVCETLWGRTLGKLATGLIVVADDGRPPNFGRAVVRTLFRLVEVNPFLIGGLPAGLVLMVTPRRQRIGDLVAGTFVVLKKDVKPVTANAEQQAIVFD